MDLKYTIETEKADEYIDDYVYVHKCDWGGLEPVVESLRVEMEELGCLTSEDFDAITGNYNSQRVKRFCKGLRKDLKL